MKLKSAFNSIIKINGAQRGDRHFFTMIFIRNNGKFGAFPFIDYDENVYVNPTLGAIVFYYGVESRF